MKEYKIALGWAIVNYFFATLLIIIFAFCLLIPIIPGLENDINKEAYWFVALLSIVMITIGGHLILDTFKSRFVIEKNRVYTIGATSKRELFFHEIKGYRLTSKFISIEPKDNSKKRLKITFYFRKTNEIKDWISANYNNLDLAEAIEEKQEILNNNEFGWNKTEREQRLNKAFKIAKPLNIIGNLIGFWTIVFPKPYLYAILVCIAFPIVAILISKYFKGLIHLNHKQNTAYPTLFFGLFIPVLAIFIRAILDFKILDYSDTVVPVLILTLICISIVLFRNEEVKAMNNGRPFFAIGLLIYSVCYAYGTYISLNCALDKSKPEIFNAIVLEKRVSTGKTTIYYIKLGAWGPKKGGGEISIPQEQYYKTNINDEVKVSLMKGKFDLSWFQVINNKYLK